MASPCVVKKIVYDFSLGVWQMREIPSIQGLHIIIRIFNTSTGVELVTRYSFLLGQMILIMQASSCRWHWEARHCFFNLPSTGNLNTTLVRRSRSPFLSNLQCITKDRTIKRIIIIKHFRVVKSPLASSILAPLRTSGNRCVLPK